MEKPTIESKRIFNMIGLLLIKCKMRKIISIEIVEHARLTNGSYSIISIPTYEITEWFALKILIFPFFRISKKRIV